MKIFYAGIQYDHYNQKRGLSFEHTNFYESLLRYPNAAVRYFPFDRILEAGKEKFNDELLQAVKSERPDLVFFFMYSDELDKQVLQELKRYTTTMAWFADDSWRFYNYSKYWATHFTWVVTTYSWMPALYKKAGQPNVIRSQWAATTETYMPMQQHILQEIPDISFVGGWSKPRENMVQLLKNRKYNVQVFGGGWPTGRRVSEAEMLELFSLSKINLGLNPPPGMFNKISLARLFLKMSTNKVAPNVHLYSNVESWFHMNVPQIKARHFQVPACGGFVMTSMADDLPNYYEPGKEIVLYHDLDDLAEKLDYYLKHDSERRAIAEAGYERTLAEHTYANRFRKIFETIGLH